MASLLDRFSKNLRNSRRNRGLSQKDLAEKAGISVSYVSMLERGQRSPPLETLEGVAKALKLTPSQLLS